MMHLLSPLFGIRPNGNWAGTGTPTNVGSYLAFASFAGSTDYNAAGSNTVVFDITPADASIAVTAATGLVYNGSPQIIVTGTATGVNGINLDNDLTINATHTNAGSYSDTWSFSDPNYAPAGGGSTDTIAQAPLSISASYSSKTYDGTVNVADGATPTVSGLYGSETVTGLTESFIAPNAGPEATVINLGFTINDGNGGNNYYVASINQGTGYILPGTPTIVVADSGGVYNGTPYAATVTINGGSTLESVSPTTFYNQFNPTTNTWNYAGDVAPTNVGDYQAWVWFRGSQDWTQETTLPVSFDITPATAAVNVTPYSVTYDGNSHAATGTTTGVNGTLPSSDLTISSTHTTAGTYADSWSFTDPNGNYAPQTGRMTDTIGQANVTVEVYSAPSMVYGTVPSFTGTVIGQFPAGNPDGLGYTATIENPLYSSSHHLDVGPYTVQAGLTGSNLNDYNVAYSNTSLTVTPASVTGSFTAANKTYDGTNAATVTSKSVTGVLAGDSVILYTYLGGTESPAIFASSNAGTWTGA